MLNTYTYSNTLSLEKTCFSIIENELELFFSSCSKSAYAYSLMISKDITSYNHQTFEKIVLSSEEISSLINNIISKLNIELNFLNLDPKSINLNSCINSTDVLEETLKSFKISQRFAKTCEKMINNTISKTFKNTYSNPATSFLFKKVSFGEKILGKNNYKNQIKMQQEKIYKQINGILINTKLNIRNILIEEVIKNLNYIEENSNYSIA